MRVAVTGGRCYRPTPSDAWALRVALRFLGATELLHGGAAGVDRWSGRVADRLRIPVRVYPYRSDLGRAGGPARNAGMIRDADACVRLPGGRGTEDCWRRAHDKGIPTIQIRRPHGP